MTGREKIAAFAKAHAPCSAHQQQDLYVELVVPVADRTPARLPYYVGPWPPGKPPSTCALAADGALAGAGIDHPPIEGHYVAGTAIAKLEAVDGGRALRLGTPNRKVFTGDILVIDDGSGFDAHVMIVTSEPRAVAEDGSYEVDTVEGGQAPDSTGVLRFEGANARTLRVKDGRLYCGHRYVVAWLDADALVIGDDMAPDAGDPISPSGSA